MENKTKKIDIKIIIIAIVSIIAIVEGIVICTSKGTAGELKEKNVIGTWISDKGYTIELYEGGSGKKGGTPLTWEIKGKFVNMIENYYNFGTKTIVYKIENNIMTNVDGEETYNKQQ